MPCLWGKAGSGAGAGAVRLLHRWQALLHATLTEMHTLQPLQTAQQPILPGMQMHCSTNGAHLLSQPEVAVDQRSRLVVPRVVAPSAAWHKLALGPVAAGRQAGQVEG